MTCKIKRIVLVLCLVAAIALVVLLPVSGYCETLRFVFMADSRGESLTEPINTSVLSAIIAQIKALSPQPAFVVFGGDMAYRGYTDSSYNFQTWKNLFTPLTSAGITLYTAIGNHELYHQHSALGFCLENQQEYQNVFTENPGNGPPGYERLVYSFSSPGGDAFFAVLDPYYLTADNSSPSWDNSSLSCSPLTLSGTIDSTQLTWLASQIANTNATHKFLFIHTPYYYVTGTNPADTSEPPSSADVTFTNLWTILDNNGFDFYACGHSHLYSRKTIDSSIPPNPQTNPPTPPWQNNVVQLLNGTCGAGVDTSTPTVDPTLWHISQAANTYYFSVVDINGGQVTITSYSGNTGVYTVFDSSTIVTAIPKLIISPDKGTIGTEFSITGSGFGTRKGRVFVGTTSSKIVQWADDSIQCQLTRTLPAGAYDVTIKPQTKGSSPITISDGFTVEAPRIDSINPPSGSIGDEITVNGLFFGTTKGGVTLGGKSCRVSKWTMDSETGESEIQFVVPRGLSTGTKELKVTNGVGADTAVILVGASYTGGDWLILDHPGAADTFPLGISGKKVVGIYYPTPSESHAFVYDGTNWTDLDYPGALYTVASGISGNKIVGSYYSDPGAQFWHGFVYDGKTWTTLDYPGAVGTHVFGIDGHTIVGYYWDGSADHGFIYDGTTWASRDYPEAAIGTFVNGISGGKVVGDYNNGHNQGLFSGYVYDGASWTPLDVPGAIQTWAFGISGDKVVGYSFSGPPGDHGYLYDLKNSTWTELDFPGADATRPRGVDDHNVVGEFVVDGVTHGFLYTIAPAPPSHGTRANGWVVGSNPADGYGVILHTTNGGYLWVRQGATNEVPNVGLNNVKAVDSHTVWVVGNSDSGYGVILRTSDGGQTWVRQGRPGMIPDVELFGVGAANRKTAWVVGAQGAILRTDDGGRTWIRQESGTTANLYEVAVINPKIAWIIGDKDNDYAVVLHTSNGGQTWERQGTAATLGAYAFIDVTAVNPRTAWAVGVDGYVAKTTNGGASWRIQMGPALSHNNGVCGVNPNTAWIATDYNVVYRTTNGGTTWDRQNLQLPYDFYLLGVSAWGRDTAWVVGGIVYPPDRGIILHTTDGGATWRIQTTPVSVTFRRASFVGSRK